MFMVERHLQGLEHLGICALLFYEPFHKDFLTPSNIVRGKVDPRKAAPLLFSFVMFGQVIWCDRVLASNQIVGFARFRDISVLGIVTSGCAIDDDGELRRIL